MDRLDCGDAGAHGWWRLVVYAANGSRSGEASDSITAATRGTGNDERRAAAEIPRFDFTSLDKAASAAGPPYSTPNMVGTQPDTTQKAALTPAVEVQKIPNVRDAGKPPAVPAAVPTSAATREAEPVEQPRKSTFSQLRLAAPKLKAGNAGTVSGESEPGIALENGASNGGAATGSALASSKGNQPSAPIAVGGEVKPVQLISSVPPAYPQLARSQRISGDVKIDALIDENGRVTSMKVVGGPVLLHQAAMDSLHQWKYRPATLDGKAVSMHLVVTVQFRLQ